MLERKAQQPEETEAEFLERENAHVRELEERRRVLRAIRAKVEARFGKPVNSR